MELFKTLLCNFIYFHRHTKWGDADMPVVTALINLWHCFFFIIYLLVTLMDTFIYVDKMFYLMPLWCFMLLMSGIAGFALLFLYCKAMCGKRYIGTLKNPKYYTKSKKIFSVCFFIGCFLLFVLSLWLMWARNNGLI